MPMHEYLDLDDGYNSSVTSFTSELNSQLTGNSDDWQNYSNSSPTTPAQFQPALHESINQMAGLKLQEQIEIVSSEGFQKQKEIEALHEHIKALKTQISQGINAKSLKSSYPIETYEDLFEMGTSKNAKQIRSLESKLCRALHLMAILDKQLLLMMKEWRSNQSDFEVLVKNEEEEALGSQAALLSDLVNKETGIGDMKNQYVKILEKQRKILRKIEREEWERATSADFCLTDIDSTPIVQAVKKAASATAGRKSNRRSRKKNSIRKMEDSGKLETLLEAMLQNEDGLASGNFKDIETMISTTKI